LILFDDTIFIMNSKQQGTLKRIFTRPVPSDIGWKAVESLFTGLGAKITEGNGSRMRVSLNGTRASFHRPHEPGTDKGVVNSVRKFLENAGIRS